MRSPHCRHRARKTAKRIKGVSPFFSFGGEHVLTPWEAEIVPLGATRTLSYESTLDILVTLCGPQVVHDLFNLVKDMLSQISIKSTL